MSVPSQASNSFLRKMPTVSVNRDRLFEALGRKFTSDEFQLLCFDFGIELDEVTTAAEVSNRQDQKVLSPEDDYVIYKIDIPANRYDLLCIEGLTMALQVFRKERETPKFVVTEPKHRMVVKSATGAIRPFVVCAVLRGVKLDKHAYNSFLDLQDKLHFNICRRRSLVSMGTHDLSKVDHTGDFVYDARKPEDIGFQPLAQDKEFSSARDLLDFYRTDPSVKHIKEYTDLIYDSPVYPVILDSKDRVMSLPPIINSEFSKISQETEDIFIEITAVDENKANIVLNTLVAMFSCYCAKPYHVEGVEVVYEDSGRVIVTPNMESRPMSASIKYLNSITGLSLEPQAICDILQKMMLAGKYDATNHAVIVSVPPTRSDVLHACDVAEDVAIAYGYNNLRKRALTTTTVGRQQPINQLTDLLRYEIAQAGFTEVLTLGLCSYVCVCVFFPLTTKCCFLMKPVTKSLDWSGNCNLLCAWIMQSCRKLLQTAAPRRWTQCLIVQPSDKGIPSVPHEPPAWHSQDHATEPRTSDRPGREAV